MVFSEKQIRKKIDEYLDNGRYGDACILINLGLVYLDLEGYDELELDFDSVTFLTVMNWNGSGGKNLYEQE